MRESFGRKRVGRKGGKEIKRKEKGHRQMSRPADSLPLTSLQRLDIEQEIKVRGAACICRAGDGASGGEVRERVRAYILGCDD